jgi:hypothetical protein
LSAVVLTVVLGFAAGIGVVAGFLTEGAVTAFTFGFDHGLANVADVVDVVDDFLSPSPGPLPNRPLNLSIAAFLKLLLL